MKAILQKLVDRQDLSPAEVEAAFESIFQGEATPAQMGAFLVALRLKGSDQLPTKWTAFATTSLVVSLKSTELASRRIEPPELTAAQSLTACAAIAGSEKSTVATVVP